MSAHCTNCTLPVAVCVCDRGKPLTSRVKLLVPQHPDEPDTVVGTARLLQQALPETRVVAGRRWEDLAEAWREPTGIGDIRPLISTSAG